MMRSLIPLLCLVVLASGTGEEAASHGEKAKLLVSYATTTLTVLSTSTTVQAYTCYSVDSSPSPCKRKRRELRPTLATSLTPDDLIPATTVESSLEEVKEGIEAKDEKLAFTIWSTTTTTLTTTSTSYNRAISISVYAPCTYSGFSGPYC